MSGDTKLSAGRLFFGDTIIAFLLLNEIRHRIVAWLFGVPREDANRMTVVAAASLADGVQGGAARVLAGAALPSAAAVVIGAGAVKETSHAIAGQWSRTAPLFGVLIAIALLGRSFGPMLRAPIRGVRGALDKAWLRRFLAVLGGH